MWQIVLLSLVPELVQGRYENVNVKLDWWETAVFYQIYTRSFMDSDGDGIGDLNGITSRLEYLKELGVDAACLAPLFKSPMNDFGYDISEYYTIQPEYGSMDDFEQLLKKAGELNIKIVLDFVINHSSNESDWFLKSAHKDEYYSDWYIWETGHFNEQGQRNPPNNWISLFRKSAWTYSPARDQFYLHQFGDAQPDFNFRNPVVVDEIKNVMKFWLEKGIAGMRIDSINYAFEVDKDLYGGRYPNEPFTGTPGLGPSDYGYLDHVYTKDQEETYDLVSQLRDVVDAISIRDNLTRILISEANTNIKNSVRYYGEGNHNGAHVPVNLALINDLPKDYDARDLKYIVDRWITYKPLRKQATWMTGKHDTSRVASRYRSELVDAFNMLVLLLPGIAFTYMAEITYGAITRGLADELTLRFDQFNNWIQDRWYLPTILAIETSGEEIGMLNGFVPWSETKDPLACNTDDPVNFIEVSRDPVRTPFQWSSGKQAGFSSSDNTWLPVADGFENVNVAAQRSAVRSHYQVYRTLTSLRIRPAFRLGRYESLALNNDVFAFKRWYNDDTYIIIMNVGRTYSIVNLTAFDLIFGQLEVETSSVLSSRTYSDNIQASYLDLAADEALVLRMQV